MRLCQIKVSPAQAVGIILVGVVAFVFLLTVVLR